ncbi:MAG: DUF1572 family protein [Saprospiraceae bacterium]|nr:DUF1572 family protein [Saprospiraceae bacterium]
MIVESLRALFGRDLNKLKTEIGLYEKESNIWLLAPGIANSAGNLCLHLVGNLNTYIGAEIGKTGYIRHRDLEFSLSNMYLEELISKVEETIKVVDMSSVFLTDADLQQEYVIHKIEGFPDNIGFILIHLEAHLTYHLGQINYGKRERGVFSNRRML